MSPVLITGVGQRAGEFLAHHFIRQGVPVVGTFRTQRSSLDALAKAGVELIQSDFTAPGALTALVARIKETCPALRAILHNASAWEADPELGQLETSIHRMMQVHVTAPLFLNTGLEPLLSQHAKRAGAAHIVHLGDYVSSRGSTKHAAYAASKAAQDNLTLSFAAKFAPLILVNSIAPALLAFNEGDEEAYKVKARDKSLLKREGGYEALAQAVDYLLSSRYTTGRILPLDGGRHLR